MPSDVGVIVDYRCTTAEALADAGERFDVVLAMEVVEHVADLPLFVRRCAEMVKPAGLMVVATLNRTLKSFALAIVGAEYILGWLPRGTHQWDKFVTPNELEALLEKNRLRVTDERGVIYNLLADAGSCPPTWTSTTWWWPSGRAVSDDRGGLAVGGVHPDRRRRADRAQCHAARADGEARHRRRHPCALPVRVSVCAAVSRRRAERRPDGRCRSPALTFWPWVLQGALAQIFATALMLAAMGERSFVVAYGLDQDRAGFGRHLRPRFFSATP